MFMRNLTILVVVGLASTLGVAGVALGLQGGSKPAQEPAAQAKQEKAKASEAKPPKDKSPPKKLTPVDATSAQPESMPLTGHKGAVRTVAFSPDGKSVATGGADKTVRIWDWSTGQQTAKMDLPGEASGVAFAPDGKQIVAGSGGKSGAVNLFDATTGKAAWRVAGLGGGAPAFSPDGMRIVSGYGKNAVTILDARMGKILMQFRGQGAGAYAKAAFSRDGKLIIFGNHSVTHLLDSQTGQLIRTFRKNSGAVTAIEPLPDGQQVAIADGERAACLLDLATGKEDKAFEGKSAIRTLSFTRDGKLAVIAREGGDIQVWNVANRKEERQFTAPGEVTAVAFSSDGNRIATVGEKGGVLIWDLTRDEKPLPADFKLTEKTLASSWADLGSDEGGKAYAALRMLRADPAKSVPFLRDHLKPRAAGPDEKKIKQWIADLDNDAFATREKASLELGKLGKAAEAPLREALASAQSLEAKKRLERLLQALGQVKPLSAEQQRDVRAVRVLEQARTPEARKVLEGLTKESPGWWVTREATASLERLKQREKK